MPVDIPTIRGKVDYDVETAIKNLASAVNQLQGSASAAAVAQMQHDLVIVRHGVESLTQRFDRLYGACHDAGIL